MILEGLMGLISPETTQWKRFEVLKERKTGKQFTKSKSDNDNYIQKEAFDYMLYESLHDKIRFDDVVGLIADN